MLTASAWRETNWCIKCVLMRVMDAVKETIADVSSVSPSSERMRGLWVEGVYPFTPKSATNVKFPLQPHQK